MESEAPSDPLAFPDLASRSLRGSVVAASDEFFAEKENLIVRLGAPGVVHAVVVDTAHFTGNFPRGCPWLVVGFAAPSLVSLVEVDTSGYLGNSPGTASVRAHAGGPWEADSSWAPLVPRTPLLPDTPHRFRVRPPAPCDLVRLDVFPDGGVARLRLHGSLTPDGLARVRRRWAETGP